MLDYVCLSGKLSGTTNFETVQVHIAERSSWGFHQQIVYAKLMSRSGWCVLKILASLILIYWATVKQQKDVGSLCYLYSLLKIVC